MDFQLPDKFSLRKIKGRHLMKRFFVEYDVPSGSDVHITLPEKLRNTLGLKRQKLEPGTSQNCRKSGNVLNKKSNVKREEKSTQTDIVEPEDLEKIDGSNLINNSEQMCDVRSENTRSDNYNDSSVPEHQNSDVAANTKYHKGSTPSFRKSPSPQRGQEMDKSSLQALNLEPVAEIPDGSSDPVIDDGNGEVKVSIEDNAILDHSKPNQLETCSPLSLEVMSTSTRLIIKATGNNGTSIADAILDKYFPVGETKREIQVTPSSDKQTLKTPWQGYPEEPEWPLDSYKRFLAICSYIRRWNEYEKSCFQG